MCDVVMITLENPVKIDAEVAIHTFIIQEQSDGLVMVGNERQQHEVEIEMLSGCENAVVDGLVQRFARKCQHHASKATVSTLAPYPHITQ